MSIEQITACYSTLMKYYQKVCAIEEEAREYNKLEKLFELQRS